MWMGGPVPLGYDVRDRKLVVNEAEAETVRSIFKRYLELGSVRELMAVLKEEDIRRSEEHTSELQSLMRISYAVFCLKKKTYNKSILLSYPISYEILN